MGNISASDLKYLYLDLNPRTRASAHPPPLKNKTRSVQPIGQKANHVFAVSFGVECTIGARSVSEVTPTAKGASQAKRTGVSGLSISQDKKITSGILMPLVMCAVLSADLRHVTRNELFDITVGDAPGPADLVRA